jgi:hypothetical protein
LRKGVGSTVESLLLWTENNANLISFLSKICKVDTFLADFKVFQDLDRDISVYYHKEVERHVKKENLAKLETTKASLNQFKTRANSLSGDVSTIANRLLWQTFSKSLFNINVQSLPEFSKEELTNICQLYLRFLSMRVNLVIKS